MRKARANELRTWQSRAGLAAAIGAALAWGACAQIVGADFDREFGAGPGGGAGAQGGNGGSGGAGGSSGPGGNGGNGGSGGAGGAGGGATNETDCTDCLDNDGDGKIDRDDDDCDPKGAFTCVETDAASTLDPFDIFVGPANEPPPPCENGSEVLAPAYENLDAEPAECGTCSCGPVAAKCGVSVTTFSDSACGTSKEDMTVSDGTCRLTVQAEFSRTTPSCGSPTVPKPLLPEPTWSRSVRGCSLAAPQGGACGDGRVCLEPTSNACIALEGEDGSCPNTYPEPIVVVSPGADSRKCSKCNCARSPCTTEYTITKFDSADSNCAMSTGSLAANAFFGVCAPAPRVKITMHPAPACMPNGNLPEGALAPTDPRTICCKTPVSTASR